MSKGGGKGRVSNDLVAASCAAVLTVYAAGYWRTRDEARRIETQAQDRRTTQPEPLPTPPPVVAETAPPAPPVVAATTPPAKPASKPANKPVAKKPAVASVPAIRSVPLEPPPKTWSTPPASPESLPVPTEEWHDGTYTGWGQSNHGDIEAFVVIEKGRIVGSGVRTCDTRYPCDVIDTILFQPVWTQAANVDRVSRATESADAYYYGLVAALKKAETGPVAAAAPQ